MPGHPREMITTAERRFPVRIRIGIPPGGFGRHHAQMTVWLDENCGADGWAMTPSASRGVLNDAVSIYFVNAGEKMHRRAGVKMHHGRGQAAPR